MNEAQRTTTLRLILLVASISMVFSVTWIMDKYTLVPQCVSYVDHTQDNIDEVFPCVDSETKRVQNGSDGREGGFTTGGLANIKPCDPNNHDLTCGDGADGVPCNPPGEIYRLNGKLVCLWKLTPRILQ